MKVLPFSEFQKLHSVGYWISVISLSSKDKLKKLHSGVVQCSMCRDERVCFF